MGSDNPTLFDSLNSTSTYVMVVDTPLMLDWRRSGAVAGSAPHCEPSRSVSPLLSKIDRWC